jgi:hypothetical protein
MLNYDILVTSTIINLVNKFCSVSSKHEIYILNLVAVLAHFPYFTTKYRLVSVSYPPPPVIMYQLTKFVETLCKHHVGSSDPTFVTV